MTLSFSMRVSAPENVLVRELNDELVLLNLDSESYFGLDEIGTRMWAVLSTSDSIKAAYETLLAEYEVEPEQLREDLNDLIEKLMEHGLLKVSNGQLD